MVSLKWRKLPCRREEINLPVILCSGQSFRWHRKDDIFQGVLAGYVWSLKQKDDTIWYYVHNEPKLKKSIKSRKTAQVETVNYEQILSDYFQLKVNLSELYHHWCSVDINFNEVSSCFPGIRILRQDPVENVMSFICSSNNNIPRITSLVEKLCQNYGEKLCEINGQSFYSFPTLEKLAKDNVESELRNLGFGYRAKFINQCAKKIVETYSPGWLESLRRLSYREAHSILVTLPGIGAKVADCICLMSLDKPEAIPVDTHVWQITVCNYLPDLKGTKSLTNKIYQQIGDFYRERFGDYAGWANTVLFAADLKQFKSISSKKKITN